MQAKLFRQTCGAAIIAVLYEWRWRVAICLAASLPILVPASSLAAVNKSPAFSSAFSKRLSAYLLASANPLGPADVLLLVNANSPVSQSVAAMYRRYYPQIGVNQVLSLSGLVDSASLTATPADEIITRADFEALIASPVRSYLISTGMVNNIYCLITTAGMPYRIEDSNSTYANAVFPAGSDANLVNSNRTAINAASVESELALLFQIDPALTPGPSGPGAPLQNRIVNPYHGYSSQIKSWAGVRNIYNRRTTLRWDLRNLYPVTAQPRIEGTYDSCGCSSKLRIMSPADIYLVARLDGPHVANVLPIFAVKDMLDRSSMVSNPTPPYKQFVGYNPGLATLVVDSSPTPQVGELAYQPAYNYPAGTTYLTYETSPVPPGREVYVGCNASCKRGTANHYDTLFTWLTGGVPTAGATVTSAMLGSFGGMFLWNDTMGIMSSSSAAFTPGKGVFGLSAYGCNGGDGRPATYLTTGGPGGGPLFPCVPGAVFTSIESFNAVTMFTGTPTSQAKIAEFIQMGGTAAIGHALEPGTDAIPQVEYLFWNLLKDQDGDGVGDLSLAEAAFTALPYLSWTEVLIGDPLMRLRTGPGGLVSLTGNCVADINGDGFVGYADRLRVLAAYNSAIGDPRYDPAADLNRDGFVGYYDHVLVLGSYNRSCP